MARGGGRDPADGDLFVRLIKMLVVPVVLVTIAAGIATLGDPRRLGSIGLRTVGLFAATTLVSVSIGMAAGLILRPGAAMSLGGVVPHVLGAAVTPADQLLSIVPLNIVEALVRGDMLAIIFVAVLLGTGTILAGEAGKPVAALLQGLSAVLLQIVRLVMEATPFGVLALIAQAVAVNGAGVFVHVGWLALAVVLASLVQMLVVHAGLIRFVARVPVTRFFKGIVDALIVAFSTASSSATLPVALRVAQDNLGVSRAVASTVLPLGASIGKDGTAMYVGLLGQFALQALGIVPDATMLVTMLLDRRAGRVRHCTRAVRLAVHVGGDAVGGGGQHGADRAGDRTGAAVRPPARHDAHRAFRLRQSDGGDAGRAWRRGVGRRAVPRAGGRIASASLRCCP